MTELLTPLHIIFCLFSTMAVISGLAVILARNPVHSVLSLVLTFFAMAGNWMLLHAEFLSLILLLVYVGAVMTLFLFVVMMLNIDREARLGGFVHYLPFGIILVMVITGLTMVAFGPHYFGFEVIKPPEEVANSSNLARVGYLLYTQYVYPFEIAGVVLLTAIIAAITLTHRGPVKRKVQRPQDQVSRRPEDSVKIIKMAPEPKQED